MMAMWMIALAMVGAEQLSDDFDGGIGSRWALRQQIDGSVSAAPAPRRAGRAMLAHTGPKRVEVAKADLVYRTARPLATGSRIDVEFDLYVPRGMPLNSLQLLDLECATCGPDDNPGIRLYLRHGRLRIDRSKIGIRHAWTRDTAPMLVHDRWYRIAASVLVAPDDRGAARVLVDEREVLAARGATVTNRGGQYIDRIQIGITANSNPVPAMLYIDNAVIRAR